MRKNKVETLKTQLKKSNEQFNNLTTFLIANLNFGGGYVQRIADAELTAKEKKVEYEIIIKN